MDESVPQARQRQGQGQGQLLYRLQAEAADFIKRKSVDCGGQEGINTTCLFHKQTRHNKHIMKITNMVIHKKSALWKDISWFKARRGSDLQPVVP